MIIKGKSAIRTAHYSWKFPRNHLCKKRESPGWCGSVGWSLPCKLKGWQFDSPSGHMPGSQAGSQARSPAGVRMRGNPSMFLSLSFSLPSPLNLKKKKKKRKKSVPYLSGELSPRLLFWPLPQSTCSSGRPNAELQMLAHPSFPPMLSKELMTF